MAFPNAWLRRRAQPALLRRLLLAMVVLLTPLTAAGGPLDHAMDSVLVVHSNDIEDRFLGSAFLWSGAGAGSQGSRDMLAVTNAHVVGTAEELRLTDRNGHETTGRVIARDALRDVAVIALPAHEGWQGLQPATATPSLGTPVFALGAPLGIEFSLTQGMISARARQVQPAAPILMLQHDAAVNPGSSGGPLVDAGGGLLGMNSQIADGSRMFVGIAYAIPAPELERIVAGLIAETLPPLPALGLTARPLDRRTAAALGTGATGLLVDDTRPGGLARAAGLQGGDLLLAVNGLPLLRPGDLIFALEAAQPQGLAHLTLLRAGTRLELELDLTPASADAPAGQRLRQVGDAPASPERIRSYSLTALGVTIDPDGRVGALTEQSPALHAGLARGDRILAVNGNRLEPAALTELKIDGPVLFLLEAPDGVSRHVYLDPWASTAGPRPLGGANVLDPGVLVF